VKRIYLNAGHGINVNGGEDPGAIGPAGTHEHDIALLVAGRLGHYLRAAGFATLGAIKECRTTATANATRAGAALFVSIHCNAAESHQAHGFEICYKDDGDRRCATAITVYAKAILTKYPVRNRGMVHRDKLSNGPGDTPNDGLQVLNSCGAMPAVLIELAFISNIKEEQLLNTPTFREEIAAAIAKGIAAYLAA
jgi:N-acetylmuramoyl-L-alanine amidase